MILIGNRLFALGILVIPFVVSEQLTGYATFPKLLLLHLLVYWVLLISLADKGFRQNLLGNLRKLVNVSILAILVVGAFSISYSIDRFEAVHSFNLAWVGFLLFIWIQSIPRAAQLLKTLQTVFLLSGIGIAALVVFQFYSGWEGIGQSVAPAATFFNKNAAAHFLIVSLCFSIAQFWNHKSKALGLFSILSICFQFLAFFLINSQASTLSFLFSLFIIIGALFIKYRIEVVGWLKIYRKVGLMILGVLCFSLLVANVSFQLRDENSILGSWFQTDKYFEEKDAQVAVFHESSSIRVRLSMYRNTWHMIVHSGIGGVGLGSWNDFYPSIPSETGDYRAILLNKMPHTAHNDYLQFFAETGWVGGLLMLVSIALIIAALFMLYWQNLDLTITRLPVLVALLAMLINATLSSFASLPWDTAMVALCLGMLLNTSSNQGLDEDSATLNPLTKYFSLLLGLLAAAMMTTLVFGQRLKADAYWTELLKSFNKGDFTAAIEAGERAREILPVHDRYLPYLARSYFNTGQFQAAEEAFNQYLKSHPYHLLNRYQLVETYRKQQKFGAAMKLSEETLPLLPHDNDLNFQYALLLVDTSQIAKALAHFEFMFETADTELQLPLLYWITQLSFVLNDLEKCAQTIITIEAILPDYAPLYQWMRTQIARPEGRAKIQKVRDIIAGRAD